MQENKLTGNDMFKMVKEECERILGNTNKPKIGQNEGKKNVVMYLGIRSGKVGWYEEKWEGLVSKDKKDFGKYEGEIKFGLPNGEGLFTTTDGKKYIGEWKDGRPNGKGTETFPDGRKYVGEWKDDKKNGQGTETYPNGERYVGEFKNGYRNGQGTYIWTNGDKYEGEYKDGKPHGQGISTLHNGNKYVGGYKYGKEHGQGTYTRSDGRKYVGEWKDGKKHGQGKLILPDGKKYVGKWKDGRPWDGIGYKNNEEIEFRVVDGKRSVGNKVREKNEQKTINYSGGDWYIGELKDGKRHGQGTYNWSDGTKQEGTWRNGEIWVGLHYNKEGYVIGVEVNELLEVEMNRRVDDIENKEVLYKRKVNKEWRWYKSGDDKKDDKYSGEVENGVPNGIGKLTDSYGGTHVGEWKNGEESGIGIRTWGVNGGKYIGEFSNGILMKGILYDKNGKITGRTY